MAWKNVQYENGKCRTSEGGGGGTVTDVEVDGVSVVNQQGVAEIPAIPDGLHHYSTSERVIGTWTDGKPLYEKVLANISLPQNTWVNVLTNISDYYIVGGTVLRDGEPIPFGAFNSNIISVAVLRNSVLKIQMISNYSETYSINRLIVRYTKTTD